MRKYKFMMEKVTREKVEVVIKGPSEEAFQEFLIDDVIGALQSKHLLDPDVKENGFEQYYEFSQDYPYIPRKCLMGNNTKHDIQIDDKGYLC